MYKDFPFDKVCETAERLASEGFKVYQKFTCAGCGTRLTIDEPNHFHRMGSCDKCNVITNIEQRGCNYMVIKGMT
jgi:hypothetical protein